MAIENILLPHAVRYSAHAAQLATAHPVGFAIAGLAVSVAAGVKIGEVTAPAVIKGSLLLGRFGSRLARRVKLAAANYVVNNMSDEVEMIDNVVPSARRAVG